ncbi:MAG: nitrogen fixation protein NifH [Chloroflexi bacterium]|nr:nitrogen fixation protein NifH [Chloroflexota bacterium]
MTSWQEFLNADPLPWLLEDDNPAVKQAALRSLLDRPQDHPDLIRARAAAMEADPIASILAAQQPEGYWVKAGPGYSPKYTGTVWQVIFLDQLGADGDDPRVRLACEYVLAHAQTEAGGFGASYADTSGAPPPSSAIHCLNGNLLRALIGFGWLADERVQRAVDWQARSITGEDFSCYYQSGTSGPGFCCAANEKLPCAWGAVKAMLALARIPPGERPPHIQRAVQAGIDFLLSRDPVKADYPAGFGNTKPSQSWFKLGFPLGYVTDVLQNLEALCELDLAGDPRLQPAIQWLITKQDRQGRWRNEYAYNGKTWVDFEGQGQPSKWVTLRACRVLKAVSGEVRSA